MIYCAETFAKGQHGEQKYGDKPYHVHLLAVVTSVKRFSDEDCLINAAWLHDVIEDTDITYFDVARKFGTTTANVAWACTGIGPNRKARNAHIYAKLPIYPGAPLVKLADRMANMLAGIEEGNKDKFLMYAIEHWNFGSVVYSFVPDEMYKEYLAILKEGVVKFKGEWHDSWYAPHDRFYN